MNFPTGLGEGVIAGPGAIEVNPMVWVSFHQELRARWAVASLGIFNLLPVPLPIFFHSPEGLSSFEVPTQGYLAVSWSYSQGQA